MTVSRQRRWQLKQVGLHRCRQCGRALNTPSVALCSDCLLRHRHAQRARYHSQPWDPITRRGRPPLTEDPQ